MSVTQITPLPTPPSRQDPTNFAARADDFLGALPAFQTQANQLATDVNTLATASEAASASAIQASNVSAWVSGTTYTEGQCRYDTTNFLTYRRKTNGAGTTRPGLDSTNWQLITGQGDVYTTSEQTLTNKTINALNSDGSILNIGNGQVVKDLNGNLGLGVTPSANGSVYYRSLELGKAGCGLFAATNWVTGSELTYITGNAVIIYSGGPLWLYGNNGNAATYAIEDGNHIWYTAPSGIAGNPITFTQSMTLDTIGNLLVGYTGSNGAYKLQVNSQIFATSSTIATSDGRYKTDVVDLKGDALKIVNALHPVQFSWKKHPIHAFDTNTPTIGFIAQEVQQVLADKPYLNSIVKLNNCTIVEEQKDKDGNIVNPAVTEDFLGIAEGNMIAILTAAIQEQQEMLKDQQAMLKDQQAMLKEQQAMIKNLTSRIDLLEGKQ